MMLVSNMGTSELILLKNKRLMKTCIYSAIQDTSIKKKKNYMLNNACMERLVNAKNKAKIV